MKKSDPAHIATDEEIAKIEKLITKEYKKAHKEVSKKCEDYFATFAAKDAKWQEWVAQGTKTQKEYKEWRQGQMLVGKKWEDLRDTLAQDYTNAAQITMSITKGFAPEVYAINHNYATFEVEKKSLIDTSYTLYSKETVEYMYKGKPKLYHTYGKAVAKEIKEGKQYAWDRRRITSVLTQAVLQGESIPRITKRLEQVTVGDHKAAIRNARTMMTGVQNAGRIDALERAQDMGIPVKKQWLATVDGRTRHWHRELDGVAVDYDEPFKNEIGEIMFPGDPEADGANVYNCFVGDTKIATDSNIVRSYKHDYSGQLFTIKSASGIEFTCTPNHPILTASGWVAAERLKYGDNLLIASACENSFLRVNPDIDHAFARIDAIHDFFNMSGGKRATSVMVNFHGDIPTSDVEIITQKRFLRSDGNASGSNGVDKLLLKHADKTLMGKGAFVKHFGRIGFAALSFVSGMSKTLSFFFGSVRHTVVHSFRSIAGSDAIVLESKTDNMSRDSKLICKGLNGSSSIVFADDIVDIKVSSVCHMPVYNLQTENGYYFVNSIIAESGQECNNIGAIAHNCRCTILPVVAGFEIDVEDMDLRANKDLGDMTYDEWKASKTSISNPITAQEDKGKAIAGAWNAKYGKGGTIENPTHKHTAAEGKALMDKYANETLAETPISTKTIRNYENPVAKAVGRERYDEIIDALDEAKETDVKKLFQQHIDEVKVISHNSKGGAYCSVQSISWNAEKGRVDTRLKKAFSTFYHESGHAIDNMLAKEKGGIWHFSTSWNGGEFSKTIKEEVSSWVEGIKNDLKAGLKAHATDVKWLQEKGLLSEYGLQHLEYLANKNGCTVEDILSKKFKVPDAKRFMPKVVNQNAYNVITKEIREIQQTEHGEWKIADISDILEGATKGNLQCGWGHGKSYWKDTDVAVEAFAEMMQAHTVNEESLKVLEKYLPKSVGAFRRMCADAVR